MINVGRRSSELGTKKRSIERKISFGPNSVKVIAIVILAAFSLFYLSQSSQSAARTIQVSDLEAKQKDINAEKERMEVEANRLRALSIIQDQADKNKMEQVTQ
jgi:hypothetical protein